MLDPTQTLLVAVITTLTILLTIIGIQVVQILKEVKKTLEKVNGMLDKSDHLLTSIAEPLEEMSDFFSGLKKGAGVLTLLSRFIKKKKTAEEE